MIIGAGCGARILGVVLNKVKMHGGRYGYDYYYKDNVKY
jgi:hypothetical protein